MMLNVRPRASTTVTVTCAFCSRPASFARQRFARSVPVTVSAATTPLGVTSSKVMATWRPGTVESPLANVVNKNRVAVVAGSRTPFAKAGTSLKDVHVTELARAMRRANKKDLAALKAILESR